MAQKRRADLPLPIGLEHVWNWFCAVAATRSNNGFGLLPISFGELAAWSRLSCAEPTPWEISLIRRIDMAVLPILNAKDKGDDKEPDTVAAADDIAGVRNVMSILKARAKAVYGKKSANDSARHKV
jgi:hypothetical protein